MRPTIAGYCIAKNEEENIGRMLSSVVPYVDKFFVIDTGSSDKTIEIAKHFGCEIVEVKDNRFVHSIYEGGHPIFNFDEAKNFALSQIPKDFKYTIWLDSDDELLDGKNIPKCLELMEELKLSALYCRYLYYVDFDEKGNVKNINIEHLRERIVRHDGSHKWIGKLHETLIEQRPTLKNDNYDIAVLHHTTPDRMEKAMWRNLDTVQEIVIAEEGKDPRNIYYLAKTLFDLHDPLFHEYIIDLLKQYLQTSGWSEERGQAWVFLSSIHIERNELEDAINASLMSFHENPSFPDPYINLAIAYTLKRDWQRALHWAKLSSVVEMPKTTLVITPKDLQTRLLEVIWHCCVNLGKLDEAEQAVDKLLALVPDNQEIQKRKVAIQEVKRDNVLAQSIAKLAFFHKEKGDQERLLATLSAMPAHIAYEPAMIGLRNDVLPPKKWGTDEIAIYCGPGFERWNPGNLEKGLGGSETAVIYLSRELNKLGWKITIFGDPGENEIRDGEVIYKPYFHFNSKDEFNIFIAWRQPGLYDLDIQANKKLVWLHDVQNPADYTEERLKRIDKVVFLSQAHRETAPTVPDEKVYISTNGIDLEKILKAKEKKLERNPLWCFWGSSYDRGLEHLLKVWPEVYKEVSDKLKSPELHIFYGWQLFDTIHSNNPSSMAWKEKIQKLMQQPGITHHGRVGQDELFDWMTKCSLWTYPTHFYEINCITAIQAQALGCIPVYVDYAALKETCQFGDKIEGDIYDKETLEKYKEILVKRLLSPEDNELREKMSKWAIEKYGWEKVAKDWSKNLLRPILKI